MRVSLVIPTWNGMPRLAEVLAAVERQPGAAELERVAVDSGSRDGTVECLRQHRFAVLAIAQRDFNHGASRDLAIAQCRGDVVVLLTQDATPADERWLPELVAVYDDPLVGAAYCRQVPRPDCNPFIAQRLREWTAGKTEPVVQEPASLAELEQLEPLQRLQRCAYDNVAGSVRRSVWAQHPFGRRRFGEDVAFGKRLITGGYRIIYQPKSAVVHSHNRSPRAEGQRIYCDHYNLKELFGVHLVPTLRECLRSASWARRHYAAQAAALDLEPRASRALQRWARRYATWATLGMYLGGNADRLSRGWRGLWFRRLDRWMRRGI